MRALLFCLAALATAATAQPSFGATATVDAEAYAYGQPITVTYTLRNESLEVATVWASSECYPGLLFSPLIDVTVSSEDACTLAEEPVTIEAGGSFVATWQLDPTLTGVPETDGEQRVTVHLSGRCGFGSAWDPATDQDTHAFHCDVGAEATFSAPRFLGGVLTVQYALADADSVAALKRTYHAVVADSSTYGSAGTAVAETWQISGVTLGDAVDALGRNGVIGEVWPNRTVVLDRHYYVAIEPAPEVAVLTAPSPNPTTGTALVRVRLDRTEPVTVEVLDLLGRRVQRLHSGPLAAGVEHVFTVGRDLSAGVYVVRATGETVRQSRRLVVAR